MIAHLCDLAGRTTLGIALLWWSIGSVATLRADDAASVDGLFITVQNPITDATLNQMKNSIDRALNQPGRQVKKVVFDFNPGDGEAATPNYGSCHDFADYIKKLKDNGVFTIAFVHAKTYRHTVLPVLACNDLVMSTEAKIGDVAEPNEIVPQDVRDMYARVAGFEKEGVVLKMLDKNITVVSGRFKGTQIYVDLDKIKQKDPRFDGVFVNENNPVVVLPAGTVGLYNLEESLRFGLCVKTAENRQAVAESYNLSTASLREDRQAGRKVKAVRIDISSPIDETLHQKLKAQFKEIASKKENLIFFMIEYSGECGGSAKVARDIADEIRELRNDDRDPIWTVAFIPNKCPDLATFIAFACSEIVMYRGSDRSQEATIGDFGPFLSSAVRSNDPSNTPDYIRRNLSEIAQQQGYPAKIVDAMLDRDARIILVRDLSKPGAAHELMSGRDFEAERAKKNAQLKDIKTIKQPGSLLVMDTTLAKELRVASQTTVDNKDPKDLFVLYGLTDKDVRDSHPGWLDDCAAFLRRTEIIFLLLAVAFAALILEFKMPGATVPGLCSLFCFILFFWSQAYAHGATIYLAIGLFVLGLIMLGVEIFILPGFGVMGIGGVLLVLSSVGLATMEKAPSSPDEWMTFGTRLAQYGLSLFVAGIMAMMLARYLPKIPYANRLMLVPPSDKPDIDDEGSPLPGVNRAVALLGQVGTATSMLRPAGMARFGDVYVDVVTEGGFVEPGASIQIIEVEGTRIVVKKV